MTEEKQKNIIVRKAQKKILNSEGKQVDAWVYQQCDVPLITFKDLVKECLEACGVSTNLTIGIADALSNRIAFYMKIGHGVRLDGVGTFKPVINSKSAPTAEELPPVEEAVHVKLRFYPHPPLMEVMKNSKCEYYKTLDEE